MLRIFLQVIAIPVATMSWSGAGGQTHLAYRRSRRHPPLRLQPEEHVHFYVCVFDGVLKVVLDDLWHPRKLAFMFVGNRRIGAGKNRLALTVLPVTVALVSGRILKMLQKQELLAHIP